ncbi:MAG: VTT domain-containing protein [Saprospiraceae bacterium]|nr:VTT domain-containing protein [Saprospiraceae bacterium]
MRQIFLFGFLAVSIIIPFLIWGDQLMDRFAMEGAITWLTDYGKWAWLAAIVLLISDLLLPIPGTLVMAALGYVYGPVLGGILAACGSFISGALGYWICRSFGEGGAKRILGEKDFRKGMQVFNKVGGWLVVLSRWLPIFPEVIACMAGLNRMSIRKFHSALVISALPMGFAYAIIGHSGVENPTSAIVLSAVIPPIIWLLVRPIFNQKKSSVKHSNDDAEI